jgi:Mrp family chromosome partitioning ATPase
VLTQPPPPGWTFDASLVPTGLDSLCQALAGQHGQACLVVGVAGFAELTREKSRMAAGIAAALSQRARLRVLLLEGDFQSPTAHKSMQVEMPIAAGLSQQLQVRRNKGGADQPWVVVECGPMLHVLGEGVIRSPGAILSQQYEVCLKEMRACYDIIVVDGPAVTSDVESRAYAELIDGVVIATPRAGMELPYDITAIFAGSRFLMSHPCLAGR